jgi:hypothetical protein
MLVEAEAVVKLVALVDQAVLEAEALVELVQAQ